MEGGGCRCSCGDVGRAGNRKGCERALITNQGVSLFEGLFTVGGNSLPNGELEPFACCSKFAVSSRICVNFIVLSLPNIVLNQPAEQTKFSRGLTATGLLRRKDKEPTF